MVVGGTGYTGRRIVEILLGQGEKSVGILTGHPSRPHEFREHVSIHAFNFEDKAKLVESLRWTDTVYNTYWVRFKRGSVGFEQAVANSQTLFDACRAAGVRRVVHISITNPSEQSKYGYFKGKALVEKALMKTLDSYAVLRPTIVYGAGDILINNIAWIMRKYRFFPVFGSGEYRVTPVYVGDLATKAVELASKSGNFVVDAVGPESLTFRGLVSSLAEALDKKIRVVRTARSVAVFLGWILSLSLGEPVVTREEVGALMDELLFSEATPIGQTKFTEWVKQNSGSLGLRFASEIKRHYV
jgi:uncharacterized protein YbjT (DUF2867 family)